MCIRDRNTPTTNVSSKVGYNDTDPPPHFVAGVDNYHQIQIKVIYLILHHYKSSDTNQNAVLLLKT